MNELPGFRRSGARSYALEGVLVRRLDTVKDEADDNLFPRLALRAAFRSSALGFLAELGPFAVDHVANVEHQAVQSPRQQDLVLVVGRLVEEGEIVRLSLRLGRTRKGARYRSRGRSRGHRRMRARCSHSVFKRQLSTGSLARARYGACRTWLTSAVKSFGSTVAAV